MKAFRLIATAGAFLATGFAAHAEPATYKLDRSHTHILFKVNHMGLSNTYGQFDTFDGTLALDNENPENSELSVTIDAASVDTNHAERDKHLRGEDFFNAEEHPEITFESTRIEKTGEKTAKVHGNLTLLGTTKEVVLDATLNYLGDHPLPQVDAKVAGFTAETEIKRTEFGMNAYAPAVSDVVQITINTEALKQ